MANRLLVYVYNMKWLLYTYTLYRPTYGGNDVTREGHLQRFNDKMPRESISRSSELLHYMLMLNDTLKY